MTNLKLASKPPQPRSPERVALASAHAARAEAERDRDEARRAVARGKDELGKAEIRLDAARTETSTAAEGAVRRELEFGLQRVADAERQWSLAPNIQAWIEARNALVAGDADHPLPGA